MNITAYIVGKDNIVRKAHGRFVTLRNSKGAYTVFRDGICGMETNAKWAKPSLWDFSPEILHKTADCCREMLIEDEEFRCWKAGSAAGLKEYRRRVSRASDAEILCEYFGVPPCEVSAGN